MVFFTPRERATLLALSLIALLGVAANVWRAHHERVTVQLAPAPPAAAQWERAMQTAQHLSLNTATAAEFERLPGVGSTLAARIVAYRSSHGPFRSIEELARVDGIGPALLATVREYVSL